MVEQEKKTDQERILAAIEILKTTDKDFVKSLEKLAWLSQHKPIQFAIAKMQLNKF